MTLFTNIEIIDYLVSLKFGYSSTIPMSLTDFDYSANISNELSDLIDTYRKELFAMKHEDLSSLYKQEQLKQSEKIKLNFELKERSRFFNLPNANANFEHWSKAAHWSLDEAIALSFGKDPNIVNWVKVKPLTDVSKFARDYASRRDLALRAVPWKKLYDPMPPSIFLSWSKELQLEIPAALITEVEKMGGTATNWLEKYQEIERKYQKQSKELSALETNTKALNAKFNEVLHQLKDAINKNEQFIIDSINEDMTAEISKYPTELTAAVQAGRAVFNTTGKSKPKAKIEVWLDTHETFKGLSNEAKERIATVANWDKLGGATRTG